MSLSSIFTQKCVFKLFFCVSKQLELLKKGVELTEEVNLKQTAQDLLDVWTEESKQFKTNYKLKDDYLKKIVSSQRLDRHLVLLVNKKGNNKNYFTLPLDHHKEGETLRQVTISVNYVLHK